MKLAVIVLTFNEELNLPQCLASVKGWADEIYLLDSGSTDRTIEIATNAGARVIFHPFETHSSQWNWALENLPVVSDWILAIDADQRVTPELKSEISRGLGKDPEIAGYYLPRRQVFLGRWIRYGAYYPKYLLKLFRRNRARADANDLVDHHFLVDGPVAFLKGDLVEDNVKERNLSFWMQKHVHYAALQAEQEFKSRSANWEGRLMGTPDERIRWLKSLWARLPLFVRPVLYFGYRYFLRAGFLDGTEGVIFHGFQGFWYRMLVDIRLSEMR